MKYYIIFLLLIVATSCTEDCTIQKKSKYNVVWNTPSESSFGSMPLGNGDIGLNVWVESSGDLLFYISKVNAFDSEHLLPKLGRLRISCVPAPDITKFRQELCLEDATIRITMDDLEWAIRVDAETNNIVLTGNGQVDRKAKVVLETLRPLQPADKTLPDKGCVGVRFDNETDVLAWAYRNMSSVWAERIKEQNSASFVAKVKDPILHRTSGGYVSGKGFIRENKTSLIQENASKDVNVVVKIASTQPSSLEEWMKDIKSQLPPDTRKHNRYWKTFWNRSFINITSCGNDSVNLDQCRYTQFDQGSKAYEGVKKIESNLNAFQISQRYALERFCEAAAGRGEVPPPYNGSIFTMDMPAGVLGFDATKSHSVSPDGRDWAILSFMWQNTRHPLWSMATRGDYDCLYTGLKFVHNGLEVCRDRCQKLFDHGGAFIMEASWWNNVGVFNWDEVPEHLRYHLLATIEMPAIMCEYYEHTDDKEFLKNVLLPCADEFIQFYEEHFPQRDKNGRYTQVGVGCAETFQGVTNPCTEIGCLKYLLSKLISFDIDKERHEKWSKLLSEMPDVPLRIIRGRKLLAVGDVYAPARTNCESPELYSIYPFRQVWLGKDTLLGIARLSHHLRTISLDGSVDGQGVETGGWQSAPVQAAYLGLAKEAARLVSINFNDQFINWNDNIQFDTTDSTRNHREWRKRPRPRFDAFWECKMDGTPDNDHGANSANTLQSMLLQSDGDKIFILPAFPEDWSVTFRLKAAHNTTVECIYEKGKIQSLKVTPKYRHKDIIDCSSPEYRIKTLVQTALCDFNYLYGIPPMLDAQPIGGNATGDWVKKYGYTLEGCKAGIFENAVFKDNTVYLHLLDFNGEVRLPKIAHILTDYKFITGNGKLTETTNEWVINGTPDEINTIVKLTFDQSLEPLALSLPSNGSLTLNKKKREKKEDGWFIIEVEFDNVEDFSRMELCIVNPNHLRGEGKPYELQTKDTNGNWKTIHRGSVYGKICGKSFQRTSANEVRIRTQAVGIEQFDIFKQ